MVTEFNYPKDTVLKKCIAKLKREQKFYVSPQGKQALSYAIQILEKNLEAEMQQLNGMFDAGMMAQKILKG